MSSAVAPATLVPRLLLGAAPDVRLLTVRGTALLVDISGFTVLSERLASAGREGTEELIATLSRVFTVLLSATDDGGDVLKFAGDALLIVYTGADHARRAAHSAWIMQRVLAAVGDIRLRNAATRLRMSAGVHSGRFDIALTGEQTKNAVIAGSDAWRVLGLQASAAAGQVLVSAETARALPPRLVSADEPIPGARRLLGAGQVRTDSLMTLHAVERTHAERFLPQAFVARPDLLGAEPDHRWAAMGFVSVEGLPAELDAAAMDRIDELTSIVEAAVAGTGATLLDIDAAPGGYRYFLTAGAPRGVEDPEGSLIAALQSVVSAPTPYPVRAGAASGRVFAGFVGTSTRQTYTTMGDATNLAARLTARAAPAALLVASDTAARADVRVSLRDRASIAVKGKSKPIPVGVVDEIGSRSVGLAALPFFGRSEETGVVAAGTAVLVSGPPGIGKSALIAHALVGRTEVRVAGDRYAARTAYGTMRQLVRPLLSIPRDAAPDEAGRLLQARLRQIAPGLSKWATLIADVIGADVAPGRAVRSLDDEFRAERTRAVLGDLLGTLLPARATVVVEDAQWVDAASAAALSGLLPAAGHDLVVARRDVEGGLAAGADLVELPGLDDEAAAELVEAAAGHSLLPADLSAVLRRGAGNPLYLIELSAAIRGGDEPRALEQLIGERIDALTERDRHLVREAAVLGTRVPQALFERCLGSAEALPAEFLSVHDDIVSFRSDLFREVAYEQLSFHQRRLRHRSAATALEEDPQLGGGSSDAMLAAHYEAVGDWAAASEAARRSAESAERAFALPDAMHAYRAAAASARRAHADRALLQQLWEAAGRVGLGGGRTGDALDSYDQARSLARDAASRARIDRQRAYALNLLGRPADAKAALRRARRNARTAGDHARALEGTILVAETGMLLRQSRWRDMQRLAKQAIDLLEEHAGSPEEKSALADAYRYHDIAALETDGEGAMVHLQRALQLCDEIGDAKSKSKVLSLIGVGAYWRGDWSTAAALYEQAQQASDAAGDTVGAATDSANAAEVLIDQGRIDAARPLLRQARRVFAAVDDTYLVAYVTSFAGRADLRAGDPVSAIQEFEQAAAVFGELGEDASVVDAQLRRTEALIDIDERDAARAEIARLGARDDLEGVPLSQLRRQAARLAELDGRPGQAAELLRSATYAAGSVRYERALCLAALARHSEPGETQLADEAEAILTELGVVDIPRLLGRSALPAPSAPAPVPNPQEIEVSR